MNQEELKQRLMELIYKHSPRLVEEEASCLAARLIANGVTIRERGEWEEHTYGELKCSACGIMQEDELRRYNFCPHCGADMRGVKDENCSM